MSETNNNMQEQKPKISKLAIVSLLIPFGVSVFSFCFILLLNSRKFGDLPYQLLMVLLPAVCLTPIAFVLGILALIKIRKSQGLLKGYIISILGILMCMPSCHYSMAGLGSVRPTNRIILCQSKMVMIAKTMRMYANDNEHRYPPEDQWCDLLLQYAEDDKFLFKCPDAMLLGYKGRCSYAMNPNCEPNSSNNIVLLFESKGGWNQYGGPELLCFDTHYIKGGNVLFNDGRVEFVKPKDAGKLKWKDEQKQ